MSFFAFSDVLGCTRFKFGDWVELGPTFSELLLLGVPCSSFFDFLEWVSSCKL